MTATTGYQAGVDTTGFQISYAAETVWGTLPTVQFQAIRSTSETLAGTKKRDRPSEIMTTGEVAQAVTTQESAGGQVSFALSFGTFDDWLSAALDADWQAAQVISGAAGDITITAGTNVLSSPTAGKFTNIAAGQYIRTFGFTNAGNNGFWRVSAKADAMHLTLAGTATIVTETPALAAAQVRASTITNGTTFKSLYVQKMLSTALFLRYPGAYVSDFSLSGGIGKFLSGSFSVLTQAESQSVTNASTGAVLAAPSGGFHDPVGGFGGVLWNDAAVAATVDSFDIKATSQGAALEFGMGSALAAGVTSGLLGVSGTLKMFFKDFTYYTLFKAETQGRLAFITKDRSGNAYVISLPNCALMNPTIQAGGPSLPVYATFTIEGNPQSAGGTLQIDRLPAT